MESELAGRLRSAGIDPQAFPDPRRAWEALALAEGERATLLDRYALEAEHLGIDPVRLSPEARSRLAEQVLSWRYPGLELIGPGGGDPVVVVPYDPRWPAAYRTWHDRLAAALPAARIEHIGSTSIPDLAAKPVVDVQISVSDVEDEDGYAGTIESCGVPLRSREPGHRYFRPARGRRRVVQIHVCEAGSLREHDCLLFRDYLRSHHDVRDAYGTLKIDLAGRYTHDRPAYTEAKTGFILDVLVEAERWARRTGWSIGPGA